MAVHALLALARLHHPLILLTRYHIGQTSPARLLTLMRCDQDSALPEYDPLCATV